MAMLKDAKLNKALDILNRAWISYSLGDIDDVLVKCRQTLHEIGMQVRMAGFETELEQSDKEGRKYIQITLTGRDFLAL